MTEADLQNHPAEALRLTIEYVLGPSFATDGERVAWLRAWYRGDETREAIRAHIRAQLQKVAP